jgi:hypothetical protein
VNKLTTRTFSKVQSDQKVSGMAFSVGNDMFHSTIEFSRKRYLRSQIVDVHYGQGYNLTVIHHYSGLCYVASDTLEGKLVLKGRDLPRIGQRIAAIPARIDEGAGFVEFQQT